MILMGMELPVPAIRGQLASGIDIIVHLGRLRDRSRKLLEVAEVMGMEESGQIILSTLYRFMETGEENGKIVGVWRKENEITHRFKFEMAGNDGGGCRVAVLSVPDSRRHPLPFCVSLLFIQAEGGAREEEKDPLGAVQGTAGQREQCAQIRGFPGECLSGRI